jgi:hypothetical protein
VTIPGTNVAARSLAEAVQCLEGYSSDARISDLIRKLEALQDAYETEQPEPDRDGEVAEAMIETESIRKAEHLPPAIRERAGKAAAALQYEHLARLSPAGAEAWLTRQAR